MSGSDKREEVLSLFTTLFSRSTFRVAWLTSEILRFVYQLPWRCCYSLGTRIYMHVANARLKQMYTEHHPHG